MLNKADVIELFINEQVLSFGQFVLKSGRKSPYFFNLGALCSGKAIAALGGYYAEGLSESGFEDVSLFGPAYKGIPIVTATAMAISIKQGTDVPFAYNRKEIKGHGEGGIMVGAKSPSFVVVDDVISAGATAYDMITQLQDDGIQVKAWMVALDRQERGSEDDAVASEWLKNKTGVPVLSLITLTDLLGYVQDHADFQAYAHDLKAYREAYGVRP